MTEREKEILNYLKNDPMISQNELAELMQITRSSVSVHISNLMKKGYIKGKGYVISEEIDEVIVIGGANVDITGYLSEKVNPEDSNPGTVSMAFGGVGRNIAENLAHLGVQVRLLSAVGDDVYGHQLIESCSTIGIDMSMTKRINQGRTSVYMQVLDHAGQLNVAVSDMKIMDEITIEDLEMNKKYLNRAKAIVMEGNLSEDVIKYLTKFYNEKLFFDPVSVAKSIKIKKYLKDIYCITPNLQESESILEGDYDLESAIMAFRSEGVTFPVITNGGKGIVYYDHAVKSMHAFPVDIISVTGAGDAFMAGLVYGFMKDMPQQETLHYGLVLASFALEVDGSVNNQINLEIVNNRIKEKLC